MAIKNNIRVELKMNIVQDSSDPWYKPVQGIKLLMPGKTKKIYGHEGIF